MLPGNLLLLLYQETKEPRYKLAGRSHSQALRQLSADERRWLLARDE
jgi:hypothetical protein